MLSEESELGSVVVRLASGRSHWCSLSPSMDLDGKSFIPSLLGLHEVLVDSLEGPCRV